MPDASPYERLGGAFAVAVVIDHFSDAVVRNPISPAEFDAVAAELARSLDVFKVPEPEKGEVLAAFAAHKSEVNAGYTG